MTSSINIRADGLHQVLCLSAGELRNGRLLKGNNEPVADDAEISLSDEERSASSRQKSLERCREPRIRSDYTMKTRHPRLELKGEVYWPASPVALSNLHGVADNAGFAGD